MAPAHEPLSQSEAWAFYWSAWQYLLVKGEPPEQIAASDAHQDLEGLGVFLMLGVADESTNPVSLSVAVGVSGRGMIVGRRNDTYGVGYFHNDIQDPALPQLSLLKGPTEGLKAYYNFAIAESIALTFDFQWTRSALPPGGAFVIGIRLNVQF